MKLPRSEYRDQFDLVEPQINVEGVHTWSFDAPCPVDVVFLFMSLFKRVTGLSFVTNFNHFRIERAQALLARTDESMASISQQVGFCDQSYFGTVFRRIVGMTPATYRRRVRNNSLSDQRQSYHMPRVQAESMPALGHGKGNPLRNPRPTPSAGESFMKAQAKRLRPDDDPADTAQ